MIILVKQTDILIGSDSDVLLWFTGTITSCLLNAYFKIAFDAWEWVQDVQWFWVNLLFGRNLQ